LAYIFVAVCIGLSSFKFVQWAPKDASFLRALVMTYLSCYGALEIVRVLLFGRSGSSKVDDFGTNRKRE